MKGFFSSSAVSKSKPPSSLIPKCGACGLFKTCNSPKMPHSGKGKKRILLVGEAPGKNEDDKGKQFVGESGQLLESTLDKIGIDMRRDCWITNALICRPPSNRTPTDKEIGYCRANLTRTIKETKPETIITLGQAPLKSLIGGIWKEDVGSVSRWVGWQIPYQKLNVWICPTYHPSYISRSKQSEAAVVRVLFERHLKAAVNKRSRPFADAIPDYRSMVERVFDVTKAAAILRKMIDRGGTIAFDYETNMLKPESDKAEIVCCSVCWEGEKTIAFPWHGEVVKAMRDLLKSDLHKITAGKLEERWTRKFFGFGIRNWEWDVLNGAHWENNREGITSVKFQAFVRLGQESYNDHIRPLMRPRNKGGNNVNRIDEIDLDDLLLYNGLDSLLEFEIAKLQRNKYAS